MPTATEAQRFFEKVILDYSCGDIKWFIRNRAKPLGPFLACVSAGVDTVGGMISGFSTPSTGRSVAFIRDFMEQDEVTANLIYSCARCGYMHEGVGQYRFGWFTAYRKDLTRELLFRRRDNEVVLNVVAYATSYLRAIKSIWNCHRHVLQYLPEPSKKVLKLFDQSFVDTLPCLEDTIEYVESKISRKLSMRGSHSSQDIQNRMKYWLREGYLPLL